MMPSDALLGSRVSLRVSLRSSRPVRAFVRPDQVRFRVVAPDGETRTCAIQRVERAPIPDLFARLGTRTGPSYTLEARAYCGPHAFDAAGIYEVTPLVVLDADGSAWRFDTPLGTFEGTPTPVRVRTGAVR
jgi:hypothetical protein